MTRSIPVLSAALFAAVLLSLSACTSSESEAQHHQDANSPAGKLGQAAHKVAVGTEKAAQAAGRNLEKAAHQAHEGWKESARKDQNSKK